MIQVGNIPIVEDAKQSLVTSPPALCQKLVKMKIPRLCLAATSVFGLHFADQKLRPVNDSLLEGLVLPDGSSNANDASDTQANDKSIKKMQTEHLQRAIASAKNQCWLKMSESGIPGLIIAVSVDGKTVFKHGFGYADVENKVLATPAHVMRIASISKPIAMMAAAR